MVGVYGQSVEKMLQYVKPDVPADLQKGVALLLVLGTNCGAGDAYAGLILNQLDPRIIMNFAKLAEQQGIKLLNLGILPFSAIIVGHLDELANAYLTKEGSELCQKGALSGKGI